jgi:hypothetical protein
MKELAYEREEEIQKLMKENLTFQDEIDTVLNSKDPNFQDTKILLSQVFFTYNS